MRRLRLLSVAAIAAAAAGCHVAGEMTSSLGRGTTSVAETVGIVRKDMLSNAQQVIADTKINAGAMTIEARADRADTTYDLDQPIALSVKVSKNAHVAILSVLPNGSTTLLYPNRKHPKADVAADTVLTVPSPDDPVAIKASPAGVVLFEFVASTAGDSWLFHRAADKESDFVDLGGTTRSIAKYMIDSLKVNKGPETAATYLTVRVSK
jgi:hypothetical protein